MYVETRRPIVLGKGDKSVTLFITKFKSDKFVESENPEANKIKPLEMCFYFSPHLSTEKLFADDGKTFPFAKQSPFAEKQKIIQPKICL